MAVYNTEEFLEKSIQSVLDQTYKNIELILINDNSNDGSKQKIEEIARLDNRISLYKFQERRGVGASRNFGIEKATGEFIYFMDSDDYLDERTLEILINNINNNNIIRGRMRTTNFSSSFSIIFDGLFQIKTFTDDRYRLIRNNSAQNFLFKKEFIINKKLSFSEEVEVFSDLDFMLPALINVDQVPFVREAIYFRRRRNDPVSNPSLSQYSDEIRIKDFLFMYNHLKERYSDHMASDFLDKQLLNFYRKDIVVYFKDKENIEVVFEQLSQATRKIERNKLREYDWVLKKEIRALQLGEKAKFKRINARHHFMRNIRGGLKTKRKFLVLLYRTLFLNLPVKENLIFFESFLGKNYSDSPKYIYQYMIENNMNFKYIWSVNEKKEIPGNPIQVKRFSPKYFYYLARSKYWVSNSRLPKFLDKRKENIYLQTWHGTPLKQLVFDMKDVYSADPNYKSKFYEQSRRWDYLSSANQYSSEIFKRAFKYDKQLLELGYPRNDILYQKDNAKDILALKNEMGIPTDKKVVLYAPTWRDDQVISAGKYKFELQLDLAKMQKELGDQYIVILRMHYFIASHLDISEFSGFAYDFSEYDDIAELYLVSDMLITDYSSVFFDYANLKRPILFYTYDLEKYRDTLRGFYIDIEKEVPGPLVMSSDEVIEAILNIDQINNDYKNRYEDFYNRFCQWDNGRASEKTVKLVFKGNNIKF